MHLKKWWRLWSCFCAMIAGAVFLSACAPGAFRQDFKGFNSAYADMLNEQMLLNLARLDNGHPAQFLAIGSIDSRFNFGTTASGGFNPSNTNSTVQSGTQSIVAKILSLTGRGISNTLSTVTGETASLNLTASSTPEFQWIPLNNEAVAKQVLQPMDPEVFYELYQQGYPVDQLLRVMVERIETTLQGHDVVLINSPTEGNLECYARFLRACEMLRELQRAGALVLETSKIYVPVARFSKAAPPPKPGGPEKAAAADPDTGFQPTPEEVLNAEKDGYEWHKVEKMEGVWELGKNQQQPKFYLKGDTENPVNIILAGHVIEDTPENRVAINNLITLLKDGFTIQTTVRQHKTATTCLILRSFSRALGATASEQEGFNELLKKKDSYASFFDVVPPPQRRPILKTCWDGEKADLVRPLVKLNYDGKNYQITDPVSATALDNAATWNRDVYRLLIALNSQVTVDISKFQRQILELQQ